MIFSPTILYIDIHLSQGAKDGVWYKLTSNFKEVEGNSSLNTFTGKFITGGLSVVAYYLIDVRGGGILLFNFVIAAHQLHGCLPLFMTASRVQHRPT